MKSVGLIVLWLLGSAAAVSVAFAGIALVDDDLVDPPPAQVGATTNLAAGSSSSVVETPSTQADSQPEGRADRDQVATGPDPGDGDEARDQPTQSVAGDRSDPAGSTSAAERSPTVSPAATPTPPSQEAGNGSAAGSTIASPPTTPATAATDKSDPAAGSPEPTPKPNPPATEPTATAVPATPEPTATSIPPEPTAPTAEPTPIPPTPEPTATAIPPTPEPTATAIPPTPIPPTPEPTATVELAAQVVTFNLIGGTTAISFSAAGVEVLWATPNPNFEVEIQPGSDNVRVQFESDDHRSRIDAWWSDGPRNEIDEDDD